jgi:hypothetical protein
MSQIDSDQSFRMLLEFLKVHFRFKHKLSRFDRRIDIGGNGIAGRLERRYRKRLFIKTSYRNLWAGGIFFVKQKVNSLRLIVNSDYYFSFDSEGGFLALLQDFGRAI